MAEIISAFLEREKEDKKIFIILSMVIVQAVQAYFQSCKSDNRWTLFTSSEEVVLVFRLLKACYPGYNYIINIIYKLCICIMR